MRTAFLICFLMVIAQALAAHPAANDNNANPSRQERNFLQFLTEILAPWLPKPHQNGTESWQWSAESSDEWSPSNSTEWN